MTLSCKLESESYTEDQLMALQKRSLVNIILASSPTHSHSAGSEGSILVAPPLANKRSICTGVS